MKDALVKRGIAKSENVQIKLFYPEIKFEKIANKSLFSPLQKLGNTFLLCYPASFYTHKNHEVLFKAVELLCQSTKLKIILTLDQQQVLNALRDNNIDKQIFERFICIPNIPREEMYHLYNKVDAMIYPSKNESLGLPLLEAVQFSLPVLASNAPYVKNLIRNATTFDPNDYISVHQVLEKAYESYQQGKLKSAIMREDACIVKDPSTYLEYTLG